MFNIADYSKTINSRVNQLNERFAELQSNAQLIQQEMRFIELEIAGLDGQSTVIRLIESQFPVVTKENKVEENN